MMSDFPGSRPLWSFLARSFLALFLAMMLVSGAMAQDTPRAPTVTVVEATQAEVIGQVRITGTLVARDEILVHPQVTGYTIDKLYFDIGDTVTEGEVLAELNDLTLAAQLAQAKAEFASVEAQIGQAGSQINAARAALTQAEAELARAQQLRQSGTGTQASLDTATASAATARANLASAVDGLAVAQAQKLQAKAGLDIARLNLDHATIKAPHSGLISARDTQVGAIAASGGEPIFRLIANGIIEVEAEVVETSLSGISSGDLVVLIIAGVGEVSGRVRLISPTVDPLTRLGTVKVSINDAQHLRVGLFASGWVITERRQALTIPSSAVLTGADSAYVLVVNDGVVSRRDIVAGLLWQNLREVVTGLEPGDVVMARAGAFFAEGDLVNPVVSAAAEAGK